MDGEVLWMVTRTGLGHLLIKFGGFGLEEGEPQSQPDKLDTWSCYIKMVQSHLVLGMVTQTGLEHPLN